MMYPKLLASHMHTRVYTHTKPVPCHLPCRTWFCQPHLGPRRTCCPCPAGRRTGSVGCWSPAPPACSGSTWSPSASPSCRAGLPRLGYKNQNDSTHTLTRVVWILCQIFQQILDILLSALVLIAFHFFTLFSQLSAKH